MSGKSYDTPKRHSIIKVRLTEQEKADFAKVCKLLGMTQSEVIRRAIRGMAIKPIVVRNDGGEAVLDALSKLLTQCGRIGGNLNQIAKRLNQGEHANENLCAEVRAALAELAAFRVNAQKVIGEVYFCLFLPMLDSVFCCKALFICQLLHVILFTVLLLRKNNKCV